MIFLREKIFVKFIDLQCCPDLNPIEHIFYWVYFVCSNKNRGIIQLHTGTSIQNFKIAILCMSEICYHKMSSTTPWTVWKFVVRPVHLCGMTRVYISEVLMRHTVNTFTLLCVLQKCYFLFILLNCYVMSHIIMRICITFFSYYFLQDRKTAWTLIFIDQCIFFTERF